MDDDAQHSPAIRSPRFRVGATVEGRYLLHRELGRGGFGTVYFVTQPEKTNGYALKVLLPEHELNRGVREMFRQEAETWIAMGLSAFVVRARWIDQLEGELCIVMDFISPDEHNRISLADFLASKNPPSDQQLLTWAVHCCLGMEHAQSHGLRLHRDLKPSNVLISPDRFAKITDFGTAVLAFGTTAVAASQNVSIVGTLPYMAPEAFDNPGSLDERSDIYSFGVMLFEMLAGTKPFSTHSNRPEDWYALHKASAIPDIDFPGRTVAEQCLAKRPRARFPSFRDVRQALEEVLEELHVAPVTIPSLDELTASDWNNTAMSLMILGRYAEALKCVDKALRLSPKFARAWSNRGIVLDKLGFPEEECLTCYREALRLDGSLALPWHNIAGIQLKQGRLNEALRAFDRAIAFDPTYLPASNDRAWTALRLGRVDEAIQSLEFVVESDPGMARAWRNLAEAYTQSRKHIRALEAYDRAIELRPDAETLARRAGLLSRLGRDQAAESDYVQALTMDPANVLAHYGLGLFAEQRQDLADALAHFEAGLRTDPSNSNCWYGKGNVLRSIGDLEGGVMCYQQCIKHAPSFQLAWVNIGACLSELGKDKDALPYLVESTRLSPNDPVAWWNRAATEARLGKMDQAAESYRTIQRVARSLNPQMAQYASKWLARSSSPGRES